MVINKIERLLEENMFYKTVLPVAGTLGGAYLGQQAANDFSAGVDKQGDYEFGAVGAIDKGLDLVRDNSSTNEWDALLDNPKTALIKAINPTDYKDFGNYGQSVAHETLKDKDVFQNIISANSPEYKEHVLNSIKGNTEAKLLASGAGLGLLAGSGIGAAGNAIHNKINNIIRHKKG